MDSAARFTTNNSDLINPAALFQSQSHQPKAQKLHRSLCSCISTTTTTTATYIKSMWRIRRIGLGSDPCTLRAASCSNDAQRLLIGEEFSNNWAGCCCSLMSSQQHQPQCPLSFATGPPLHRSATSPPTTSSPTDQSWGIVGLK